MNRREDDFIPDELYFRPICAMPASREYKYIMSIPRSIKSLHRDKLREEVPSNVFNIDYVFDFCQ